MVNEKNKHVTIIGLFRKPIAIIQGASTGFPGGCVEVFTQYLRVTDGMSSNTAFTCISTGHMLIVKNKG